MALIRYPGSKDRHLKFLRPLIDPLASRGGGIVVEPFAGTASVTFDLLRRGIAEGYVLNDYDESMVALWRAIRDEHEALLRMVVDHQPTVEDFYEFKQNPGTGTLERAYRKIVLHQTSYSGLGAVAGSPIGGREQKGDYKVDCRWSVGRLVDGIVELNGLLTKTRGAITHGDWETALTQAAEREYFIYLDPPYIDRGKNLYLSGVIDHDALAARLRERQDKNWLVSYDDSERIPELYDWARVDRLNVTSYLHHKTITDVIIRPKETSREQ